MPPQLEGILETAFAIPAAALAAWEAWLVQGGVPVVEKKR